MSRQRIIEQIHEDWGTKPQSKICVAILEYLLRINNNGSFHITYGSLRKAVGMVFDDKDLLMAVQYLCGDKIHLLETRFELIDNESSIDISNSELKIARVTGKLVNPENGELVSDFEDKVVVYFQPSSLVTNISG
jgi:hypothetical protein